MMYLQILIAVTLLIIFFEDLRRRSIYWLWFPILIGEAVASRVIAGETYLELAGTTLFNVVFILLQLLLVTAWFSLRRSAWIRITDTMLGWGDIFFFLVIALFLHPVLFVPFYLISLMIIIICWLIWSLMIPDGKETIPLAGSQAILLLGAMCLLWSGWSSAKIHNFLEQWNN